MSNMLEDLLHKPARRLRIIKCNVVCDCIKIIECWFGPDYLSHLDIRCFACL